MHEINTVKVMMVCMTIIRIYVVNVTAGSQRSDIEFFQPARGTLKV